MTRFSLLLLVAAVAAVAFLVLPIVAIFAQTAPDVLVTQAGSETFRDALVVSLVTSAIAHAFVLVFGTPTAYLLATKSFRGRDAVLALLELPLVLPPAVAGIGLLYTFGKSGLLDGPLTAVGVEHVVFTRLAVVLAVIFVSSPFYIRTAVAAFESVDDQLLDAARTLGAAPARAFWRVALPLAAGGLAAGSSLAWARGLGEFGATLMFAGSLRGVTQTLPLAIYAELNGGSPDVALAIGALLVLVSVVVLVLVRVFSKWQPFTSISVIPSAASSSS